jgi:hypothetical protein
VISIFLQFEQAEEAMARLRSLGPILLYIRFAQVAFRLAHQALVRVKRLPILHIHSACLASSSRILRL